MNQNPIHDQLLNVLTREGVLVKVSIHFWRGTKKLTPEDIGLKESQVSDRLISLGHKRLLPKEALSALALVEGRAHAFVENNTFPFLNGLAHFVPNPRLPEVCDKLRELEREFWAAKKQFLEQYASLRKSASEEWRAMAKKLVPDPERLVTAIEASYPFPVEMDRYYSFEAQLFQIAVPERLGLDLISLADQNQIVQARQKAAQEAAAKIHQGVELFVADCVSSLREQTAQLCEDMLHSISTSETGVHQKTLYRLVRFIDQFKQMNFANDTEMEQQLERVRRELLTRTAEDYRDNARAKQTLVNGLTQLRQQASELAKQDATELVQRFGSLGVRKFNLAA